jgi:hypothetical protein
MDLRVHDSISFFVVVMFWWYLFGRYQAAPGITPKDMPGPMANPMYGMGMDEPNYNVVDQSSGVLYSVALDEESC